MSLLEEKRQEDQFNILLDQAEEMAKVHQLEGSSIPRTKKPPKRLDENPQTTHKFTSARELYRVKFYFHALDTTIEALKSRFHNKTSLLCRNIKYLTVSKMDGSDDALRGIKQLCDHFEGDITQPSATLAEYKILCRHVQNMKNAQKTPGLGTSKEHEGYTKHEYDKPHDNDSNDPTNNYEQIADDEKDDENDEANDEENDQVVQSVEENNSLHSLAAVLRSNDMYRAYPGNDFTCHFCKG